MYEEHCHPEMGVVKRAWQLVLECFRGSWQLGLIINFFLFGPNEQVCKFCANIG